MPQTTTTSRLLESVLPGAWIAKHQHIWQMNFLNADKLASFSHDRGLAYFNENDVIHLWQLGLVKADLIKSRGKLRLVGLVDCGSDLYGNHIYSDERQLPKKLTRWDNAVKTLNRDCIIVCVNGPKLNH